MSDPDALADLAVYYDPIMSEIDYDRWLMAATVIAGLVSNPAFTHLDIACGTGHLLKRLAAQGWRSFGVDLSCSMLHAGRRTCPGIAVATADMCALPFRGCFDFVTCLFDSINFLLERGQLDRAFLEWAQVLSSEGVLYFDYITEKMVTEHFEGQTWTEESGGFPTTWKGTYDRSTSVASTLIRVKNGPSTIIHERIYSAHEIEEAVENAGFTILGIFDSENWKALRRKTLRVDVVACKNDSNSKKRLFRRMKNRIQEMLV